MKLSETALALLNATAKQEDRPVCRRADTPQVVDLNVCRVRVKQ